MIAAFITAPITPTNFCQFEIALVALVRELGRLILQAVAESLEPQDPKLLPRDVTYLCGGYRRRGDRTRNANIATRLGNITLWRRGYRS